MAAAALLAVCVLPACVNDPSEVAALFPHEQRPDAEIITNFETIYSDSARVKVRITGPRLLRYEEPEGFVQLFPEGAFVEFFDPDGAVTSTLASRHGIRYESQDRVVVRDSVVWLSATGDRLDSDELVWEAGEQRLYSDRFVRLRQGNQVITGVGFESDQDFKRSRVRAIQGVVMVEE